jgi:hypothetical protein
VKRNPVAVILLSFLLAFAGAGFTSIEKTVHSTSEKTSSCSISSFNPPHTELEIHSLQAGHPVQGSHHFQKLAGHFTSGGKKGGHYQSYKLSSTQEPTSIWTKEYLSHIYPSHNFW